jgi:DNA repair protein RadA/Sms
MAQIKSIYICSSCGETSPKWVGKCPSCSAWNSFVEDAVDSKTFKAIENNAREVINLDLRKKSAHEIIQTGIGEFDRVVGGGIVSDAFILLSGDPGIGKSTLALQVAGSLVKQSKVVLYITGEESAAQVAARAERIGIKSGNLKLLSETNLDVAMATLMKEKPDFVLVDSAQVMYSNSVTGTAGNIAQTRAVAEQLMRYAKTHTVPVMLIGHVNKSGDLAGPKALEHLVDTVLYLEGDKYQQFRLLRTQKNRYGSTQELGVFEMDKEGMQEVKNPSASFLEGRKKNAVGSVITSTIEGTRPFLVEVQALTTKGTWSYPKRTASGFDLNRLQLLLAVLTKHAKIKLDDQDVFVNVTGGFRVQEPATDLSVAIAVASSRLEKPVPNDTVIFGEIGLAGELRPVPQLDQRLKEAERLGFTRALLPATKQKISTGLELCSISDISELHKFL